MGIRLYPYGEYDECLLAGVPQETKARLDAHDKLMETLSESEWFEKLHADEDMHTLETFRTFGWGRITGAVSVYLDTIGQDDVCGHIDDPAKTKMILALQGVTLPEGAVVTAVMWG